MNERTVSFSHHRRFPDRTSFLGETLVDRIDGTCQLPPHVPIEHSQFFPLSPSQFLPAYEAKWIKRKLVHFAQDQRAIPDWENPLREDTLFYDIRYCTVNHKMGYLGNMEPHF